MERSLAILSVVLLIVPTASPWAAAQLPDQVPPSTDDVDRTVEDSLDEADRIVTENDPTGEVPTPTRLRARSIVDGLGEKLDAYKSLFLSGGLEQVPVEDLNLSNATIREGILPNRTYYSGLDLGLDLDLVKVPYACVDVTPSMGNSSTTFTADASCSTDVQTSVRNLQVRFDWTTDGTWDTGWLANKSAQHQYSTSGAKVLTAQLKDPNGLTSVAQETVVVDDPPSACFDVSPTSGTTSTTFDVDATCTTDDFTATSLIEVRWDWESDGVWDTSWSTDKTASHSYGTSGTKTITVQARDAYAGTDAASRSVDINDPPTACFDVSPTSGTTSTTFDVDASCSSDDQTSTANLEARWDWTSDGTWDTAWSTTKTASHSYGSTGDKTIRVQVRDGIGLTDTAEHTVTVGSGGGGDGGDGGGGGGGGGSDCDGSSTGDGSTETQSGGTTSDGTSGGARTTTSDGGSDTACTQSSSGSSTATTGSEEIPDLSNETLDELLPGNGSAPSSSPPNGTVLFQMAPKGPRRPASHDEVDYRPGQRLAFDPNEPLVKAYVEIGWLAEAFGTYGAPAPFDVVTYNGTRYAVVDDPVILSGQRDAFRPITLGQSDLFTVGHRGMVTLEDRAMQVTFQQVPGWETVPTNRTREGPNGTHRGAGRPTARTNRTVDGPNGSRNVSRQIYRDALVVNLSAPDTLGQPVRVNKAWLASAGIHDPEVLHEDGTSVPVNTTARHYVAYPEHFSTLILRDDDGEMDTSAQLDYSDDHAVKRLELSSTALDGATSATLHVYGTVDSCGASGDSHWLEANGNWVLDFNVCNRWSTTGYSWEAFSIPLADLSAGSTNDFQIEDAYTEWADRDLHVGVDQDNDYGRSDIEVNYNSISGELMWYLEITKDTTNSAPNTPSAPSGPTSTTTGTSETYSTSTTDPDGDTIKYTFDWGDGSASATGWVSSGTTVSESHAWSSAGDYCVKVQAEDSSGATSAWSSCTWVSVAEPNSAPNTPSAPSGPSSGGPDQSLSYSTSATDPDGDDLQYTFDWDDGSTSTTGWVSSGTEVSESHAWSTTGDYCVRAQATDPAGATSDWSSCTWVTIKSSTEQIRDDDGEMDTPYQVDYKDDTAVKRLVIDSGALTDVTSAELWVYGRANSCGTGGDSHRLWVNGDQVTDFNPCSTWTSGQFGWRSFVVPVSTLKDGQTNAFEVADAHSKWADRDVNLGVDQDNDYGRTDASANGNAVAGELMWSLEITKDTTNAEPNTPSAPSGPDSGDPGQSLSYSASTTDPDGDNLRYTFDWDDGSTSTTGWVSSGATVSESHAWSSQGDRCVRVRAEDPAGETTPWSSCRWVRITDGTGQSGARHDGIITSSGHHGQSGTFIDFSNVQAQAPIEVSYKYCYIAGSNYKDATIKTVVDDQPAVDAFKFKRPYTDGSGEDRCNREDASTFGSRTVTVDTGIKDSVRFDYTNGDWRVAIADISVTDVEDSGGGGSGGDDPAPDDGGNRYVEDFEGDVSDWSFGGLWHRSDRRSQSEDHAARFGRACCDDYDTNSREVGRLTSPWIDVPRNQPRLLLKSWYETEGGDTFDRMLVKVKPEGGSWATEQVMNGEGNMREWFQPVVALDDYAGQTVKIRFVFDTSGTNHNDYEGWYVDDVRIEEGQRIYASEWTHSTVQGGSYEEKLHHDNDRDSSALLDGWGEGSRVGFDIQKSKYEGSEYAFLYVKAMSADCNGGYKYPFQLLVNDNHISKFDPCNFSSSEFEWGEVAFRVSHLTDGWNTVTVQKWCPESECPKDLWLGVDTDSGSQYSDYKDGGGELMWTLRLEAEEDYKSLERYETVEIVRPDGSRTQMHIQRAYVYGDESRSETVRSTIRDDAQGHRNRSFSIATYEDTRTYDGSRTADGLADVLLDAFAVNPGKLCTAEADFTKEPTTDNYYTGYRMETETRTWTGSGHAIDWDRYVIDLPTMPKFDPEDGSENPPPGGEDRDPNQDADPNTAEHEDYRWNFELQVFLKVPNDASCQNVYAHGGHHDHQHFRYRLHVLDIDTRESVQKATEAAIEATGWAVTVMRSNGMGKLSAFRSGLSLQGLVVSGATQFAKTGNVIDVNINEFDAETFWGKVDATRLYAAPLPSIFENQDGNWKGVPVLGHRLPDGASFDQSKEFWEEW